MNIRFTSSLTPDDENLIAPLVLQTLAGILNLLPIAYSVRIDTSDAQVYQATGNGGRSPQGAALHDADTSLEVFRLHPLP